MKKDESIIKKIEAEINKTPTGVLRNLLCDLNIAVQSQQLKLKETIQLIEENLVDNNACRYDHNGWCQTHNMTQEEDFKCPMIRIREIIKENEKI